jgi:hypothetical protein
MGEAESSRMKKNGEEQNQRMENKDDFFKRFSATSKLF